MKEPGQLSITNNEHVTIMIAQDGIIRFLVVVVPFKEIYYLT